jgi:glycosyltransferase involved in cell wall biosynthesis
MEGYDGVFGILLQNRLSNYDVIVVDNGSTDALVEKIREYCKGKN